MPETKHITRPTPYATSDDFRHVFDEDMNGLYLLSFLLIADCEKAEQCFVSGLEDSVGGRPVFKEWARSWARRTVIQNAVRVVNPRPMEGSDRSNSAGADIGTKPMIGRAEIAAVLGLEPFDRFVYVMSVLERYSDQDCSLLLGCARREVAAARTRALQRIASAMESLPQQPPNASSEKPVSQEECSSVLQLLGAPRLATSA